MDQAEPFRRITIRGLLNENDFEIQFSNDGADGGVGVAEGSDMDPLRLVYGLNGSGKTSALRIIRALLVGDISTLLSIPFQSVEIERWEPWGESVNQPIPGGIGGAFLFGDYNDSSGTFDEQYVYLKFVSEEFGNPDWYKSRITSEEKKKIEDFLSDNQTLREDVEDRSEPGAFEFWMHNAHSHTLRIERLREKDGQDVFAAEYKQNRYPYGEIGSYPEDASRFNRKLLELLDFDDRTIVALFGEETLSSGELVVKPELSEWTDFFRYLFDNGIIDETAEHGSPFDFMGMLEPSQISEMGESGILDLMEIQKVWRAFNGDRKHWNDACSMTWFDNECIGMRGHALSIDWSKFPSKEKRIVSLIGPDMKMGSKEFLSSEVSRLQGLLQETREEEKVLHGLFSEEDMLSNIEKLLNGEINSSERGVLMRSLSIASFIAENLYKGAESSLAHLITIPAVLDRMGVAEESEVSKPLLKMISIEDARRGGVPPPSRGEILGPYMAGFWKKSYYPFFEDYNNDFLINKKMKIKDDLSVIIVTDSGSVIPYTKLSHGELRLIYMLSTISDKPKTGGRWPTVLIDEPEVGLHIDWQRKLVSSIKGHYEIAPGIETRKRDAPPIMLPVKVVIATHSPEIVASSPEDAVSIEPVSDELR